MKDTKLDLSTLQKAVYSLVRGIEQPKNEFTRDAVIQRFEYTFDLCWKIIKRYLKAEAGIEEFNIKNLFRLAAQHQLISDVDAWFSYHQTRNLTSHTYNELTAEETYQVAKKFCPDAQQLLLHLENALGNPTE